MSINFILSRAVETYLDILPPVPPEADSEELLAQATAALRAGL